ITDGCKYILIAFFAQYIMLFLISLGRLFFTRSLNNINSNDNFQYKLGNIIKKIGDSEDITSGSAFVDFSGLLSLEQKNLSIESIISKTLSQIDEKRKEIDDKKNQEAFSIEELLNL
ncbi:MAG: hypothetical protein AAGG68_30485, partial [Bacteroidota bacterium]